MPRRRTTPLGLLLTVAVLAAAWAIPRTSDWLAPARATDRPPASTAQAPPASGAAESAREAFDQQISGVMLTVSGRVVRVLPDDRDGSRHQRFIVEVPDRLTLLVAHNIDLAPRVPLQTGDPIELHGQYEWNAQGGVMHWTHHDPEGTHEPGWIRHEGRRYE